MWVVEGGACALGPEPLGDWEGGLGGGTGAKRVGERACWRGGLCVGERGAGGGGKGEAGVLVEGGRSGGGCRLGGGGEGVLVLPGSLSAVCGLVSLVSFGFLVWFLRGSVFLFVHTLLLLLMRSQECNVSFDVLCFRFSVCGVDF